MILNMVGGGGSGGLNFSVVGGTSHPGNPKENTIWVNTETEISGWVFSASEPEVPAEGMVWITTGTSSTIEFNALKKNGIQVYPISAKQYVSGAWVDKTAKSYQDGQWKTWIAWLYNNGNQFSDVTGGWVVRNASGGTGSITADGKIQLRYSGYYDQHSTAYTQKKIDFTNRNVLTVEADISLAPHADFSQLHVIISEQNTEGYPHALFVARVSTATQATGKVAVELNVTDYQGAYYVGVWAMYVNADVTKVKVQ